MKQIALDTIIIRNFLSYTGEQICFTQSPGLKLIGGTNSEEPKLGANGAGKSAIWRAFRWCLYGSPRISSILSWEQNQVEVLTEVLVNDVRHTIYRCGPPERIELDDKPATQEQVERLIGLTEERFLHSVLFQQGARLFPDLSIPERGKLLDDVLNLAIWQNGVDSAGKKVASLEKTLSEKREILSYTQGQLAQLEDEQLITLRINEWEGTRKNELELLEQKKLTWNVKKELELSSIREESREWESKKQEELEIKVHEIEKAEGELGSILGLIQEISEDLDLNQFSSPLKEKEKLLVQDQRKYAYLLAEKSFKVGPREFWETKDSCPTCYQPITEDIKQQNLIKISDQEKDISNKILEQAGIVRILEEEVVGLRNKLNFVQKEVVSREERRRGYSREQNRLEDYIANLQNLAEKSLKEYQLGNPFKEVFMLKEEEVNPFLSLIDKLSSNPNPYVRLLEKNKESRNELSSQEKILTGEIKTIGSSIIAAEYWKHGFKRIRLYFVQQVLSALEVEIQSALSALGLDGWSVILSTETETKSGTTKLGVQIRIKSPKAESVWESWSGGEAQRLRIGIALGLSSLIQRAAGVFYNFSTLDEPTNWLSSEGIEDLLDCLKNYSDSHKKSVFVIDHRALQSSSFDEIWCVTKDCQGSKMERVQ